MPWRMIRDRWSARSTGSPNDSCWSRPQNASWESLKKIDLKYHELSPEGYHRVLHRESNPACGTTGRSRAGHALPPPHTPASLRGRLLREFVGGDEPLAVNWRIVRIGRESVHNVPASRLSTRALGSGQRQHAQEQPKRGPSIDDMDGGKL